MKRAICLLLLMSMLAATACGSEGTSETTTAADNVTTTEKEEGKYLDGLNFGGKKITIFCTDYGDTRAFTNMYVDMTDGDVVNDAIHTKNAYVSELLNVKLDFSEYDFDYDDRDAMYSTVRKSVMSDSEPYAITLIPTYFTSTLVSEGLLADLNTLPNVDFSREWWSEGFLDTANIGGKTYMAAGDGVLPFITGFFAMAVNKDLAAECGVGDVYKIVNDGDWTVEKLHKIAADVYRDLNGNGEIDKDDLYGLELLNPNYLLPFLTSCGISAFSKDQEKFVYSYGSERCVDAYDRVYSLVHDPEATFMTLTGDRSDERNSAPFMENRALFSLITLNNITCYRDSGFEYGVIPYPKFDETQENYYTMASNGVITFSVPVTSTGDEAVGAVIEAMGYAGSKFTTPAYFETALKIKYARDDETSQMLDLIKSSEYTSIATMFAAATGGPDDIWKNTIWFGNDGVWASTAETNREAFMSKLDSFIKSVKDSAE